MTRKTQTEFARELRKRETDSEKLLWAILRARQVCGLKFRRQYPIGPFVVDIACEAKNLVIEIDGSAHEETESQDRSRQTYLEKAGWRVLRIQVEDITHDVEAVAEFIAQSLGLEYEFNPRRGTPSGIKKTK